MNQPEFSGKDNISSSRRARSLLVTFNEVPTLFKFVEMENLLSDELDIKVDLVMKESLKPAIGKRILREAQPV